MAERMGRWPEWRKQPEHEVERRTPPWLWLAVLVFTVAFVVWLGRHAGFLP